jgi:hypothetical protein
MGTRRITSSDCARLDTRFWRRVLLELLRRMGESLQFNEEAVMAAVERELSSAHPSWDTRKLLDTHDDTDHQLGFLDEVLKDRASKSLEGHGWRDTGFRTGGR